MIAFPVPPVNTFYWTEESWARYIKEHGVETEPKIINSSFGIWDKTDQINEQGHAVYHLRSQP